MSYHEYLVSRKLAELDPPFLALIMAALRKADTVNAGKIRLAWPDVASEFERRHHSPGGRLPEEEAMPWPQWVVGLPADLTRPAVASEFERRYHAPGREDTP